MEIIRAKTAGFCFGVDRAVKLTYDLLAQGRKVATLGPLIHNAQVVADLEAKGAVTCPDIDAVPDGYEVIIRSHGVPRSVYDKISTRSLAYHDATCPFVAKIHKIAMEADKNGALLLVAGDADHPEVQGIVGHTSGSVQVFANPEELQKLLPTLLQQESIYVVAQTTFRVESWENCKAFLKKECTKARIFDTICNATWARQQEAEDLSQKCDHMVVIGGHHSSNTQKLLQVAARHTKAINVETADELDPAWLAGAARVGVTAGASTPSSIIEEVLNSMSEEIRDDMSFEEMLAASEAKPLYAGKIVKAKVISVSPTECVVGIDGSKHTGVVTLREMSHDPNAKMEDLVKVDDDLDLVVIKTNDQEGVDTLSRVRFEAQKGMKDVSEAAENGTLFLDEIGEIEITQQSKLLRALQEKEYRRVGEEKNRSFHTRIVAATNRDLRAMVAAGTFREDLFYRLNVFPIRIPPLRERLEDIPLLVENFLRKYAAMFNRGPLRMKAGQMDKLMAHSWPGNIRELQNVIQRAVILSRGNTVSVDFLRITRPGDKPAPAPDPAPAPAPAEPSQPSGGDSGSTENKPNGSGGWEWGGPVISTPTDNGCPPEEHAGGLC